MNNTESIASMLASLSNTVGSTFTLWPSECISNSLPKSEDTKPWWNDEAISIATRKARQDGLALIPLKNSYSGICIKLPSVGQGSTLAFATASTCDLVLLERLVRAARNSVDQELRIANQAVELESCLEQLTYGLEEQTWLRSLSNQLTLCSAKRSIHEVAAEVIPSLRRLVGAETAAVIFRRSSGSSSPRFSTQKSSEILWAGPRIRDDHDWKDWIEAHSSQFLNHPLVLNGPRVDAGLRRNGVRSLCAVQIGRSPSVYGWIVGINRDYSEMDSREASWTRTRDAEFGTVEAGLLDAAATLLATHGHNSDLLKDREDLIVGVIRAMGQAVDARDRYTRGHSERVGRYGRLLANALGMTKKACDRIYLAGLLHDIGKIGIPDKILGKTDKLSDDEFSIVKRHPEIGAHIVSTLPQLSDLLPGILHHHESMDGRGYPYGLSGTEIPEMGRILAVADAYDAMTSDRPYRDGMNRQRAVNILNSRSNVQWDGEIVRAFISIPEQSLILDATDGDQGWTTQEDWLRAGAESIFSNISSFATVDGGAFQVLDDSLTFDGEMLLK